MPIEPLSITAGVIAVTRLTYDTCKSLNNTINGLKSAPSKLKGLQTALRSFESMIEQDMGLNSLQDAILSPAQQASLSALQPVMQSCQASSDAFSKRLTELTSHSSEERLAKRDRIRLHFNDNEIRLLQETLGQAQRTLSDALGFANLSTATRTQQALDEFSAKFAQSASDIGGRIEGLALSMEALSIASANNNDNNNSSSSSSSNNEVAGIRRLLQEHDRLLRSCLRVYVPAAEKTSPLAAITVKYQQSFDQARLFAGTIDFEGEAQTIHVGQAEARGESRMAIGNMSAEAARNLWK